MQKWGFLEEEWMDGETEDIEELYIYIYINQFQFLGCEAKINIYYHYLKSYRLFK